MTKLVLEPDITETQSYTWVLREIFLDAAQALPFFAGFNIKRNRRVPIQIEDLPLLGVYLIDEIMSPDGDANHGEIRFLHTFRIGFSVIILNNDDAASEQKLDAAFWAIMNGLWRNEYIMSRIDTRNPHDHTMNPDNVRFEALVRGTRKHVWGNAGQSNEAPTAEMQYDVSVTYRADYPAIVADDLNKIFVTGYPSDTNPDPTEIPNVEVDYGFPYTFVPDPPWPPPWPHQATGGNPDGTSRIRSRTSRQPPQAQTGRPPRSDPKK